MKTHNLLYILIMVVIPSCQKSEVVPKQNSLLNTTTPTSKAARVNNQELQTLIRKWTEWVYSRDISVAPFNDPTGDLQQIAQPYTSEVFMLAGSSSSEPVDRVVTISLSDYQYVFVPLVVISVFYNQCDPSFGPKGGQNPEAFFQSLVKEGLNGPKALTLMWDGASLLPTKQKEVRANSGVWNFAVASSYINSCAAYPLSSAYSDGYWAKIPLTPGTHTLTVGGNFDSGKLKFSFSNIVNYTIHVEN